MNHPNTPESLLTWLDVERALKEKTLLWQQLPSGICSIDCYADGMVIAHTTQTSKELIHQWLEEIFGNSFTPSNGILLRIGDTPYPIELAEEEDGNSVEKNISYPLWKEVAYLPAPLLDNSDPPQLPSLTPPKRWENGPHLVSFHSFKGGVGRTTTMMTFAAACLDSSRNKSNKILIVDADLEAPGVGFWLNDSNRPNVSFLQFLEAMHYPPKDIEASLDFFARELNKNSITINAGHRHELFVLPAALTLEAIQDMPVQPQHLARNPINPWILSDHLHALGKRLGADVVFIDLRAGLSEMASPLIFDPRIEHYFVTTIAKQSVLGMAEILQRLHAFHHRLPKTQQNELSPSVVLSLLTQTLRKLPDYETATSRLAAAYPLLDINADSRDSCIEWLELDFSEDLMSISSIEQAFQMLQQASLYNHACNWIKAVIDESTTNSISTTATTIKKFSEPESLRKICEETQFAENDNSSQILVTEPLQNLGKFYATELPNVVIIGAKGAGKTFLYSQLCHAKYWNFFLEKIEIKTTQAPNAAIVPLLWSKDLNDEHNNRIQNLQCKKTERSMLEDIITTSLKNPPENWAHFWINLIIEQIGNSFKNLQEANQSLIKNNKSLIFIVDGLENFFPSANEENSRQALEALLRLPDRLAELSQRRIGLIILVREDYVHSTITQNVGQFTSRYTRFQLQWNPERFLRLALWLCIRAGISDAKSTDAETLPITSLIEKLERLWGKKLGKSTSKEAHSARWVYSALCDLRGNIQARDLVRFLRLAAIQEINRPATGSWKDRVIAPDSLRKALPEYSKEKVEEAKVEIAPLRDWMKRLNNINSAQKHIPFKPSDVDLDQQQLSQLKELGIIYQDENPNLGEDRLFLPEIYREGLGFITSSSGRPRIQALLKKNVKLPF